MIVKVLKTDGTISESEISTFTDIRNIIGGMVTVAGQPDVFSTVFCHEEGLLLKLPPNPHIPQLVGDLVVAPIGWDDLPYE